MKFYPFETAVQLNWLDEKHNGVILTGMGLYALTGFALGFIAGMIANAYLLRDVPRAKYLNDKSMRLRYGSLNWAIALLGMIIAIAIKQAH
jgi:hypothetical protein